MITVTYETRSNTRDSIFKENDIDTYTFTEITAHIGGHELHFKKQGDIIEPTRWVIDHALKEIIHHCGHQELLLLTECDEDEYFMPLCEDDLYDDTIIAQGGRDIRKELLNYNDDLSSNNDIFFTYYNFLKGKLTSDEILEKYEELLDIKSFVTDDEFIELTEEYDKYINRLRELRNDGWKITRGRSLADFILHRITENEWEEKGGMLNYENDD